MKTIKTIVAVGAMWLGISGAAQAYVVDWRNPYLAPQIYAPQQTKGTRLAILWKNHLSWNRMVSAWQSFTAQSNTELGGISLQVSAKAYGSLNLNIYQGAGVQGALLSSTRVEWREAFFGGTNGGWFNFKLSRPVLLQKGVEYTFALEDSTWDSSMGVAIYDAGGVDGLFMFQGIYGGTTGIRGYTKGIVSASMNFVLLQ